MILLNYVIGFALGWQLAFVFREQGSKLDVVVAIAGIICFFVLMING